MEWKPVLDELRGSDRPRLVVRPLPERAPAAVALLSGSFDPLTVAHAAMAGAALRRAGLAVLVYSVRTLPKEGTAEPPLLGETERLEWLDRFAAARGSVAVGVCSHGLLADQVAAAAELFPSAELAVVLGSDKLLQLLDPAWYEDRDAALAPMFERAAVWFTIRSGDGAAVSRLLAAPGVERWRSRIVPLDVAPGIAAVSSRGVRERLRRGEDVADLVPPELGPLLDQRLRSR